MADYSEGASEIAHGIRAVTGSASFPGLEGLLEEDLKADGGEALTDEQIESIIEYSLSSVSDPPSEIARFRNTLSRLEWSLTSSC